jgi:DNA-binding transcriptional MerR regulator
MVGRVGHYGSDHLVRLAYIDRLQQRGFSLAAIRDLLQGWDEGRSLTEVLGFEDALTAPWSDEVPERVSREQLVALFPEIAGDATLLDRAVAAGLLRPDPQDTDSFLAPSPRLVRAGADLASWGVPLAAAIEESEQLAADMVPIARRMVKLFETHVWEPFVAAGYPADRLPAVTAALQQVRPVTATAVLSVLARAMEEAVAVSTAEQTARFFSSPAISP